MPATSSPIRVRRIPLEFPAELDPVVIEGAPEESFVNIGLSLLLPYLEPYLIRSMRAAKAHITDPALLADIDAFNGQEGQHYRQHMRFNEAVRIGGIPGLAELEAEMNAEYRRFSETKSLKWNLAYAEGFEAYTSALARYSFEAGALDRLHPAMRELFTWHLLEELEHRTVAFDVYEHVCGAYFYRVWISLYAQWHLNRFVMRAARLIRDADLEGFHAKFGSKADARARVLKLCRPMVRGLLPKVLGTYLPTYSPHKIEMPAKLIQLMKHYDAMAATLESKAS